MPLASVSMYSYCLPNPSSFCRIDCSLNCAEFLVHWLNILSIAQPMMRVQSGVMFHVAWNLLRFYIFDNILYNLLLEHQKCNHYYQNQYNQGKRRTDNPLHSRNSHFPLDQVDSHVDVSNAVLYLAQNRIQFSKPDIFFYSFESENWIRSFRHYHLFNTENIQKNINSHLTQMTMSKQCMKSSEIYRWASQSCT